MTNDFPWITHDLFFEWRDHHRPDAPDLWPDDVRDEMEEVMQRVFTEVNNGVYRCGFASRRRPTRRRTTGCSPPSTGSRSASPTGAT